MISNCWRLGHTHTHTHTQLPADLSDGNPKNGNFYKCNNGTAKGTLAELQDWIQTRGISYPLDH